MAITKAQLARRDRLLPNGIPRWIRIYDNEGESGDQYTVVFTGRYTHKTARQHWYIGMSANPYHPQGIGMHGESPTQIDAPNGKWPPAVGRKCHLGLRIEWADLPPDCQRLVLDDYKYLWDIPGDNGQVEIPANATDPFA